MSGIAEVLLTMGYKVTGSDLQASDTTRRLEELGGRIFVGHQESNVGEAQVVVISSAVSAQNPEVVAAKAWRRVVVATGHQPVRRHPDPGRPAGRRVGQVQRQ